MATSNPITGATIKTSSYSAEGRKNHDRIFAKKPSTEWAKEDGLIIYDADGFDRIEKENAVTPDTPVTYKEYKKRIAHCTVLGAICNPNAKIKVTLT